MPKTAASCQLEDSLQTLKQADIQEYLQEMETKTIPAIVEIMKQRAILAEESRRFFVW